jgi:glycosyltransferase involved in cell wall biosynthesis
MSADAFSAGGTIDVSVVIPAYQAAATIGACIEAVRNQRYPAGRREIIVVDDGSRDATAEIARSYAGVTVISQPNGGAAAARNRGWREAKGTWVAFLDSDCVPSRGWLGALIEAVSTGNDQVPPMLGAAGKTLGLDSGSEAAHFADLIGSLDAERYLSHPRWPFAPSCNLMYRRAALATCDGFDERFVTYEACDLHTRLRETDPGAFAYVARAVVWHRHRSNWRAYWKQQVAYGVGYAQFARRYSGEIPWSLDAEARAWCETAALALRAALAATNRVSKERLVHRGQFVKSLAQRVGFDSAYWSQIERNRWSA